MRHVVYLLLVVNLVFLGWNIFQSQSGLQAERNLPPFPETAPPLVTWQQHLTTDDDVSQIETLTDTKPPGAGAGLVCQTLGPFLALQEVQTMEAALAGLGLAPQQREAERTYPIGYWVYLPEMPRSESQQLARMLDDHSDKEYFISKGNLISLGVFQDMSRAKQRLAQTRKMGLEPLLETRYRTATGYWLDFQAEIAASKQLDELLTDSPDIWLQDKACY
jgi:hypothetical protein